MNVFNLSFGKDSMAMLIHAEKSILPAHRNRGAMWRRCRMTDRERMIEVIKQALSPTDEAIADALIAAGFISLKESSDMAREACDILRNIKDDEIKRIAEERDDFARREEIAELVFDAMSETLFTADGGCDEICPAWDNECIRLKVAFYCGEVGIADRKIHCFKRWYKYACHEALKKRPNNFKAKIERGRKDNEETK